MKTNFFQIIAHLKSTGSWTIHISPSVNDKMVVSVLLSDPKANKEGIYLTPMIFNETPKVLDETMFSLLTAPVQQANEMWTNFAVFQKNMEEAKKVLEAKMKAKTADASKTVKKDDSAEKKQQYEDAVKKIGELNALCKYDEAIALLPSATDYPDKATDLEKLRKELETKNNQLSLL